MPTKQICRLISKSRMLIRARETSFCSFPHHKMWQANKHKNRYCHTNYGISGISANNVFDDFTKQLRQRLLLFGSANGYILEEVIIIYLNPGCVGCSLIISVSLPRTETLLAQCLLCFICRVVLQEAASPLCLIPDGAGPCQNSKTSSFTGDAQYMLSWWDCQLELLGKNIF